MFLKEVEWIFVCLRSLMMMIARHRSQIAHMLFILSSLFKYYGEHTVSTIIPSKRN